MRMGTTQWYEPAAGTWAVAALRSAALEVEAPDHLVDVRVLQGEVAHPVRSHDAADQIGGGDVDALEAQPLSDAVDPHDLGAGDVDRRDGLFQIDDERPLTAERRLDGVEGAVEHDRTPVDH